MGRVGLFPGLLALLASGIAAQVATFEGKRIADIQFSPAKILDPADLAKAQPIKKGDQLRAEDVARAIDGLFATGRFEDIVVEAEPVGAEVNLCFVTKPTWFVGGVSVEGKLVNPPNRGQVASTKQLNLGAPFHDEDLNHAVEGIKNLLKANGLYEAEVTPTVERDEDAQQIFIKFAIKEHKRAKYEMPAITGDTKLSDNTILRATGWRVPLIHWWRQVTDVRTHGGVRGLLSKYQKQDRLAARVELEKLDYDAQRHRVRPALNVDAGPKVQVKTVEAKVSKRLLKRYVPIFEEGTVDDDLLVEGKRNLQDYFQGKGYYDAEVDFRTLQPNKDLETIEYAISRGQRQKVVRLVITGNNYFHAEDIRERMFIAPASFRLRHGRYSELFRRKDEENIADLYRANGFREVKVTTAVEREYQGKSGQVAVTVRIDEGAQWLVDSLTVTGVTQGNRAEVTVGLASAPEQPFADVNLASDRDQILDYYYARGFPSANVQVTWRPTDTPHHVDVVYTIGEGERQYVRDVLISGLRTTRQNLVDKQITLKAGDPLSPIEQTDIQKRFYDLGIFARVDTAIQNPDGDTDRKYVLYNFEEANRYTVGLGFGANVGRFGTPSSTSLSSPAGSTGFSPLASLDLSRINFLGMGHTITLRGVYSSLEKRGSLSYLVPRLQNVDGQNLTFNVLYDNSLNVNTFASKREEASVQLSRRFSKSVTGSVRFAYRRVSTSDVVIPVLLIPQLTQPVRVGMFSFNFSQDRRDNPGDPHRGIYNTADIGLAGRFFASQRSFGRVLLRNATYHKLTNTLVLARQTQFGVIAPFSAPAGLTEQQSIPLPERFFGGGADSLRAFPFNQAGPRDTGMPLVPNGPASQPTGFPIGGNALFFNNVELRFPFLGQNIQGVIFHDMGNVFSTLGDVSFRFHQRNDQDFNFTVHAVGYGIRYRTPIGPIRLDLAYSINPPSFIGFSGTAAQLLTCNPNLPPSGVCVGVPQRVRHFQFFFSIGQTF
jgi:outer membrane protein assembly complex protein YaeT